MAMSSGAASPLSPLGPIPCPQTYAEVLAAMAPDELKAREVLAAMAPDELKALPNMDWNLCKREQGILNFRMRLEKQRLDMVLKWLKHIRYDQHGFKQTERGLKNILEYLGLDLATEVYKRTSVQTELPDAAQYEGLAALCKAQPEECKTDA